MSTVLDLGSNLVFGSTTYNRSGEVDLLSYSKNTIPPVSVDGRFAIENPFTGHAAGYLQVRVCVGTAEQV